MARPLTIWLLVLLAGGVLTNCTSSQSTPTPTPTPTQVLDVQEPNPGENAPATIPILRVEWQKNGPGGNQVWPAYDKEANVLYLGQYGTGFWTSEDGGITWEFIGRESPTTIAVNAIPPQAEYDELDALLRSQVIPRMQGYHKDVDGNAGLAGLNVEGEYTLATLLWLERADRVENTTQTYRFLVSRDGKTWAELEGPPVSDLFAEVYQTLILPTSEGIVIYIGTHSGFLWQTKVRHETNEGLIP